MSVDWERLTNNALGLRALTYGPGRTSLVDTRSTAAVEVTIGVGILFGEAGHVGDDNILRGCHFATTVRERELADRDGSRRDERVGCGYGRQYQVRDG